jgi:hypothetical protein
VTHIPPRRSAAAQQKLKRNGPAAVHIGKAGQKFLPNGRRGRGQATDFANLYRLASIVND